MYMIYCSIYIVSLLMQSDFTACIYMSLSMYDSQLLYEILHIIGMLYKIDVIGYILSQAAFGICIILYILCITSGTKRSLLDL